MQPEHLKSFLGLGGNIDLPTTDLDLAESKLDNKEGEKKESSSEEETNSKEKESDKDHDGVTMIKLPLELSLQEVCSNNVCIFAIQIDCYIKHSLKLD